MELEDLFREKLEGSEVIPGTGVREELLRRTARREFLRFNPARFNIYYAAGLTAAAATAIILLVSGGKNRETSNSALTPGKEQITAIIETGNPVKEQENSGNSQTEQVISKKNEALKKGNNRGLTGGDLNNIKNESKDATGGSAENKIEKASAIKENLAGDKVTGAELMKRPFASFNASSRTGCMPLKVRFKNYSTDWDSCRWTFGDGGYSLETNPEWIFDVEGEYRVTLKVFYKGKGESSYSQIIEVHPKPSARFEINPETPIIPDDEIRFTNYSSGGVKYRWDFGDGKFSEAFEPVHKYNKYAVYNVQLIAWSEYGCSDSMLVTNAYARSGCYIRFPNAFIPNSDGPSGGVYTTKSDESAQIFHPVTTGVSEYQLRIFSKTGVLLFESNDINIGWDGYHKGQLCEPGVYVWKVRGTYRNGESFVQMGDVTIIRN